LKRTTDEDKELAARSKSGDLAAFEELVRKHEHHLFSYMYWMCRNPDDAEEATQEAFVRAWKGISKFQGKSSFKTWLFRIATNLAINKRTRTKPTVELSDIIAAPKSQQPEESFRRKQKQELVQAALNRLPKDQRTALVLSVYQRMSYKEIAEAIGKSVRAVDSLLFRAKRNIRGFLRLARRKGIL